MGFVNPGFLSFAPCVVQVPQREADLEKMKGRLSERYPLDQFAEARARLDPKNILANDILDALFPVAPPSKP